MRGCSARTGTRGWDRRLDWVPQVERFDYVSWSLSKPDTSPGSRHSAWEYVPGVMVPDSASTAAAALVDTKLVMFGGRRAGPLADAVYWIDLEGDNPVWRRGPNLPQAVASLSAVVIAH